MNTAISLLLLNAALLLVCVGMLFDANPQGWIKYPLILCIAGGLLFAAIDMAKAI